MSLLNQNFVHTETGWKAFFYLSTGLLALTFAVIVPYLPETRFSRSLALSSGQGTENISTILEQDDKNTFELNTENINDVARVEAATVSLVGTGGPSKAQRWGVTAGRDPHYRVMDALIKVWLTATLGPVWLPVGWFAACKGILVGQSFIAAQIWQAAPYNFSNAAVGCTYIPAVSKLTTD